MWFVTRGFPDEPPSAFEVREGKAVPLKVLIVLDGNEAATVEIPREVKTVSLGYDPSRFGARRLELGDRAVRFEPCEDSDLTQYPGSFIVAEPICLPVDVWATDGTDYRVRIPMGTTCGSGIQISPSS